MAQIKNQKERKARKSKARASLFVVVSKEIFTRIMTIKSTYEIGSFLKNEYEGDERIKGMQALNLVREFEMQKMNESETIKEYANKLLSIANKVRLLGSEFSDSRIVEKYWWLSLKDLRLLLHPWRILRICQNLPWQNL